MGMSNDSNRPISYNKQTPKEILMFIEIIEDVYSETKKSSWSGKSHLEIGFYIKDKVTKSSIFFGIWFEAWESFGIPLSIVLDYGGKSATDRHNAIKKIIQGKNQSGLQFKDDYQGYALILINHEYLNFENDVERIASLLDQLKHNMEINL
jgi:hypothetical protein